MKPRESRLGMGVTICGMVCGVLLPLGFVALMGPVLWLAESGYMSEDVARAYCAARGVCGPSQHNVPGSH